MIDKKSFTKGIFVGVLIVLVLVVVVIATTEISKEIIDLGSGKKKVVTTYEEEEIIEVSELEGQRDQYQRILDEITRKKTDEEWIQIGKECVGQGFYYGYIESTLEVEINNLNQRLIDIGEKIEP